MVESGAERVYGDCAMTLHDEAAVYDAGPTLDDLLKDIPMPDPATD
jgi:hypothetical protein